MSYNHWNVALCRIASQPTRIDSEAISMDEIARKRITERRTENQVLKVKIQVAFLMKSQNEEEVTVVTIRI